MKVLLRKVLLAVMLVLVSVATAMSQTTVQRGASDAEAAFDKGNVLVAQGNYEHALRYYQTVGPEARELYAVALYNMGICHYELWHTAEAIVFYKRAIEQRAGSYPRASYALGVALEDLKRVGEAKDAYNQTLKASSDYAAATYRLGLIVANEGNVEAAAILFRKALKHEGPHVAASHNNLGVMLARMQLLTEAEKEFVIALRLTNGSFSDATYNLDLCRRLLAGTATRVPELRLTPNVD
jgi:tetratricopeptide (TPR) repeat protein